MNHTTTQVTPNLYILQRGVQWKQGAVVYIRLCAVLLCNTTPIHCTPSHCTIRRVRKMPNAQNAKCPLHHAKCKMNNSLDAFAKCQMPTAPPSAEYPWLSVYIHYIHIHISVYLSMSLPLSLYIYIYIYIYMYVCIYIYTHIHIIAEYPWPPTDPTLPDHFVPIRSWSPIRPFLITSYRFVPDHRSDPSWSLPFSLLLSMVH